MLARAVAITALAFASLAHAQSWPAKPIRLVVPFPPGGGTDVVAREVANKVATSTRWTFVMDNRPGSGGNIGVDAVAKAPADGYSLVIGQTSNLAINPSLYSNLPYSPLKDLTPIVAIGYSPLVIVAASDSPLRTITDAISASKAKPGHVNFATSGNGTVAHLATELLQKEAGVKLTHIPYKGAAQGLTDVLAGRVQLYVSSIPTLIGQIRNGKLRALAVTSARRVDELPQAPTVAESGHPGFEAATWFGLLGPANLPRDVVAAVNAEVNKALRADDLRKKLEEQGLEVMGGSADAFAKLIQEDMVKWGKVVRDSGAKLD